jgi:hypothetical protein
MSLARLPPSQPPFNLLRPAGTEPAFEFDPGTRVMVQRQWDGWRITSIPLSDLHEIHWDQPPHAPRPLIHAYVWCPSVDPRDFPHDCVPATAPHRVQVCILKIHTPTAVYAELVKRADRTTQKALRGAPSVR